MAGKDRGTFNNFFPFVPRPFSSPSLRAPPKRRRLRPQRQTQPLFPFPCLFCVHKPLQYLLPDMKQSSPRQRCASWSQSVRKIALMMCMMEGRREASKSDSQQNNTSRLPTHSANLPRGAPLSLSPSPAIPRASLLSVPCQVANRVCCEAREKVCLPEYDVLPPSTLAAALAAKRARARVHSRSTSRGGCELFKRGK